MKKGDFVETLHGKLRTLWLEVVRIDHRYGNIHGNPVL